MNFIDHPACAYRLACVSCRARSPDGEHFRRTTGAAFAVPPGWECPHGVPWNVAPAQVPPAPDRPAALQPAAPPPPPKPIEEWPLAARVLARMRHDGEPGLGSTAKRVLAALGAEGLASLYTRVTGKTCGCDSRQQALDRMFPYPAAGEAGAGVG